MIGMTRGYVLTELDCGDGVSTMLRGRWYKADEVDEQIDRLRRERDEAERERDDAEADLGKITQEANRRGMLLAQAENDRVAALKERDEARAALVRERAKRLEYIIGCVVGVSDGEGTYAVRLGGRPHCADWKRSFELMRRERDNAVEERNRAWTETNEAKRDLGKTRQELTDARRDGVESRVKAAHLRIAALDLLDAEDEQSEADDRRDAAVDALRKLCETATG